MAILNTQLITLSFMFSYFIKFSGTSAILLELTAYERSRVVKKNIYPRVVLPMILLETLLLSNQVYARAKLLCVLCMAMQSMNHIKQAQMLCKVTHCAGRVSANTMQVQVCMRTADDSVRTQQNGDYPVPVLCLQLRQEASIMPVARSFRLLSQPTSNFTREEYHGWQSSRWGHRR